MKIITLILASSAFLLSCNNKPAETKDKEKDPATVDTTKAPIVGNDKDEHGCIGSAGYTWSELRKDCIRIFEVGTKLNPTDAIADKTTAAFVVFDSRRSEAELYVPGQAGTSVIMEYGKKNSDMWFSEDWKLAKTAKGLTLLKDSVVLYAE